MRGKCVFGGNSGKSGKIERVRSAGTRAFDGEEVDHGGGDVGMAEEILDGSDVGAVLVTPMSQPRAMGHNPVAITYALLRQRRYVPQHR